MNEWMKKWKDERVNEWMNERINEWMNEWMNEWIPESAAHQYASASPRSNESPAYRWARLRSSCWKCCPLSGTVYCIPSYTVYIPLVIFSWFFVDRTAEPIGPEFFVGHYLTTGMGYVLSRLKVVTVNLSFP